MRRIIKGNPPPEFTRWLAENEELNCRYEDIPSDVRSGMKERMIQEQGGLCGYTGMRITATDSHIEHLKPQSRCREEGGSEDIAWDNMIAAHPRPNAQAPYGAQTKADWYEPEKFVSPLSAGCEQRFRFRRVTGKIEATNPDDEAAKETIKQLKLDHSALTDLRLAAIEGALEGISQRQLEELRERIEERSKQGLLRPFCFVLKQACEEELRLRHREQERRKAIQASKR